MRLVQALISRASPRLDDKQQMQVNPSANPISNEYVGQTEGCGVDSAQPDVCCPVWAARALGMCVCLHHFEAA